MTLYVGIDPGASGAIVVLGNDGEIRSCVDMPTVSLIVGGKTKTRVSPSGVVVYLRALGHDVVAAVEQVGAMPGQGVTSMFAFGRAFGIAETACAAAGFPMTLVAPQTWRRVLGVANGKDGSRARAAQIWPMSADTFKRVKDDGRADAALIASYARRIGVRYGEVGK